MDDFIAIVVAVVAMALAFSALIQTSIPHRFNGWGFYCTRCRASLRHRADGCAHKLYCRDKFPDYEDDVELAGVPDSCRPGWIWLCYRINGVNYRYVDGYRYRVTDHGLIRDKAELC